MKILVINLLRIGDIIMLSPTINSLKKKYPHASISLLINRECEAVAPLIKNVDRFHYFERQKIQTSLGEVDRSLFEGYDRLERAVVELDNENYDQIYNVTQNKLSGWLTGLIKSKEKFGLIIDQAAKPSFGSKWLQYLNDFEGENEVEPIHYADAFQMAFSLPRSDSIELNSSAAKVKKEKQILLQISTSDSKKNWNLQSWLNTISTFNRFNMGYKFLVLSSPLESKQHTDFVVLCKNSNLDVELFECNFTEALEKLESSSLLITLDTSIKHLASSTNIPILEISLGASDVRKTGVYRDHAVSVQSKLNCSPCVHSKPCSQSSHLCAQSIPPDLVALLANCLIKKDFMSIKILAEEYEEFVQINRSFKNENGLWTSLPCSKNQILETVPKIIDRLSWLSIIEPEAKKFKAIFIAQLGLILETVRAFGEETKLDFISQLSDYEMTCSRAYGRLIVLLGDLRQLTKQSHFDGLKPLQNKVENLVEQLQLDSRTFTLSKHLSSIYQEPLMDTKFKLEKTKNVLDLCLSRLQTEQRIIQVLTTNIGGEM